MLKHAAALIILAAALSDATAADMTPTIYSDGLACPGGCDAHVVFHRSHNGTANAFSPDSDRADPHKCVSGNSCRLCFGAPDSSCITALYRGNGPSRLRFDFTPAFYESVCGGPGLPAPLRSICGSFDRAFDRFTENAVYCPASPEAPGCPELIAAAQARKTADAVLFDECKSLGQPAFNARHSGEPALQRQDDCAYEKHGTGGPNSSGQTWRRLLPAACQTGAFAGRDGLDCCDANKMSLGGLGRECTPFLVPK